MLLKYRDSKKVTLVNSAYTELYRVRQKLRVRLTAAQLFVELETQLKQWQLPGTQLHLTSAAPRLLSLRSIVLTVPGKRNHALGLLKARTI